MKSIQIVQKFPLHKLPNKTRFIKVVHRQSLTHNFLFNFVEMNWKIKALSPATNYQVSIVTVTQSGRRSKPISSLFTTRRF